MKPQRPRANRAGVLIIMLFLGLWSVSGCERRERTRSSSSDDGAVPGEAATPAAAGGAATPAADLDWISTSGTRFVDSAGRDVLLRGVITLTHYNRGQPVEYGKETYARMAAMGITYQSIRIYADPLGAMGEAALDEEYIARVDQMIADAAAAGIYSQLKMTAYDTTDGRIEIFDEEQWAAFWRDDAQQAQWIEAWARLWERYRDEPAVVGYDLLNEPKQGALGLSDEEFEAQYLVPFYQRAINRLREIDPHHLVFVQPALIAFDAQADRVRYAPFSASVEAQGLVYAPHLYVTLRTYDTQAYGPVLAELAATAERLGVPLMIGEFGLPWLAQFDRDTQRQEAFRTAEHTVHALFDEYRIGYSRPWFADDRASLGVLNWAMFPGRRGFGGETRAWITDPLASPYPFRTAGQLSSLSFDPVSRQLELVYAADPALGPSELVIPHEPYYEGGFTLTRSDGLTVTARPSEAPQIEGIEDPSAVQWNAGNGRLSIREATAGEMRLTVSPIE